MIISSLCEYHRLMEERGEALSPAYSRVDITHALALSIEGRPVALLSKVRMEGKQKIFESVIMPRRSEKSGTEANIAEHRAKYLFGFDVVGDRYEVTANAKKSHDAFVEATIGFFRGIDDPLCQAFVKFAETWDPETECENELLADRVKEISTARIAVFLDGHPNVYLHDIPAVKDKWEKRYASRGDGGKQVLSQCPIYGEELPVARLHNKIKGVHDGQSSGCSLVSFNNDAENSYCKEQSYNSAISERAMEEYTSALNHLLKSKDHNTYIAGMTVVHFALTEDEAAYVGVVNSLFARTEDTISAEDTERSLRDIWRNIGAGRQTRFDVAVDDGIEYCMFGLVPNVSRLAVKFSYRNTFGALRSNVLRYHDDFAVADLQSAPSIFRILGALSAQKSSDPVSADMAQSLLSAVIEGVPIPQNILIAAVRRVKTDRKINDVQAGLVKACLRRRNKKYKEKLTMALNESNHDAAYLCGRLFAVLEKIQQEASGNKLNKTVKDTYFASAAATPAVIFARLMQLSQKHLAKLESQARETYFNKLVTDIVDELDIFPKTLSLEEQAEFLLGYYQQNKVFYTKKSEDKEEN